MKTERIKSFVLFSLVIVSFVLTTRIWFYISIEGLFVMSSKETQAYQPMSSNEKRNLLKPDKLVVHIGENHTLLFNDQKNQTYYSSILGNSIEILNDLLENQENYNERNLGMDKLEDIREGHAVEMIFNSHTKLDYIKGLLNVQEDLWKDVDTVRSIIISPNNRKVYIVDTAKAAIHEFTAASMPNRLENTIAEIGAKEDFAYVFLNDFNEEESQLYGQYAIAPVSIVSMPVLTVEKEIKPDENISADIAELFDEDDSSKISSLPDSDGSITFTDREEETVNVGIDGVFEYNKYNINSKKAQYSDLNLKEAINIAADYVNEHFGFKMEKGEFYLSSVESRSQVGRTPYYIVRFDYKYDGIPIVTEAQSSKSAIEVEIVGNEVKRYKRNVRPVVNVDKTVNIKTFDEVLDIVQGKLNNHLKETKSVSIKKVNDLYPAYFESERDDKLIPVWVADTEVESYVADIKINANKRYIIGAEEGFILSEQ